LPQAVFGIVNRLHIIALLCILTTVAKADYFFTWEGNSNLFRGSFEVTDAEYQPGQFYTPLSLTNSISITSPDDLTSPDALNWNLNGGGFEAYNSSPPFYFEIQIDYPQKTPQGGTLYLEADYDSIQELLILPIGTATVEYSESGLWNVTYIPEPSTAAFLALAATFWTVGRRRCASRRFK
jgi:hypothetical protein